MLSYASLNAGNVIPHTKMLFRLTKGELKIFKNLSKTFGLEIEGNRRKSKGTERTERFKLFLDFYLDKKRPHEAILALVLKQEKLYKY